MQNVPPIKIIYFVVVLTAVYFFIGIFQTLPLCPQSVHQWAQCDRASVALNFGEDTFNFFQPRVHNTNNGSGISGMEFPFINYSAGMLYRIFGHLDFIYRSLILLLLTLGVTAIFILSYEYLQNFFLSCFAVFFMLLSPVLLYYAPNFIPDTASVGLLLISWLYYFKYYRDQKKKNLIVLFITLLLASLIKITALIGVITMILMIIIQVIMPSLLKNQKLHGRNSYKLLAVLVSIIIITGLWYMYAKWLSAEHNSGLFLLNTKTTFSKEKIMDNLDYIYKHWWKQYYSSITYYAILLSVVILFIFRKYTDRQLAAITSILWAGNMIFTFIMLPQYHDHDYYIISLLPAIFFLMLTLLVTLKNAIAGTNTPVLKFIYVIALFIFANALVYGKDNYKERYHPESWMKSPEVFKKYYDIKPYIATLGIDRSKRTISVFDWSPNVTLYLMDLKGICISPDYGQEGIVKELKIGGDYLVLNDTTVIQNPEIVPFLKNKIGEKDGILFYKLEGRK